MLASSRMRQFLDVLGRHFDRIILDSPVLPRALDVLALGSYISGVILVATVGQTHREALRIIRKASSTCAAIFGLYREQAQHQQSLRRILL